MALKNYFCYQPQADQWIQQLLGSDIHPTKKAVFKAISTLGRAEPGSHISRKQLFDWLNSDEAPEVPGITNARLTQLIKEMTGNGAFTKYQLAEDKRVVFELNINLQRYLLAEVDRGSIQVSPQVHAKLARNQREALENNFSVCLLEVPSGHYGMRLVSGILDGFVRTNRHDGRRVIPRTSLTIPTRRPDDSTVVETIDIETECKSGDKSAIMELSDLAVVGALNAMFVESVITKYGVNPDKSRIPTTFVFDILDLCKALNKGHNAREHIVGRLQRIRDTTFTLHMKNAPEFRKLFRMGIQDRREFQYLTEFGYATEEIIENHDRLTADRLISTPEDEAPAEIFSNGDEFYDAKLNVMVKRVPRFYFVRFDSLMFDYLITESERHRFVFNPALLNETTMGLIHRLHSWARAFVGVRPRPHGQDILEFSFQEFHERILPTAPANTFYLQLRTAVERFLENRADTFSTTGLNRATIYGYIFEVDHRKEDVDGFFRRHPARRQRGRGRKRSINAVVRVQRDRCDQYVGDDSTHNQLLRQQLLTLGAYG